MFFSFTNIAETLITPNKIHNTKNIKRPKPALKQTLKNGVIIYFKTPNSHLESKLDGTQNTLIKTNGFSTKPFMLVFLYMSKQFSMVVINIQPPIPYASDEIPTYFGKNKMESTSTTEPIT